MSNIQGKGATRRGMVPVTITLAAGGAKRWQIEGDWFQVTAAPVNDLVVRFDSGNPIPVTQGMGLSVDYTEFELSSATGQPVTVFAGYGMMTDNRANLTATISTTVSVANTFSDGGDVATVSGAATQLLGVDATRKTAVICNPSSNTASLRVGTSAVSATKGILLEPGESVSLDCTCALWGFQASGASVTVTAAALQFV